MYHLRHHRHYCLMFLNRHYYPLPLMSLMFR
jgi:hypothetical protein